MNQIKNIHHIGIIVKDIQKSVKFYKDLGFEIISDYITYGEDIDYVMGINNLKIHAVFLKFKDSKIELIEMDPVQDNKLKKYNINDIGIRHIAFEVIDLNKLYDQLTSQNIQFTSPPRKLKNQQDDLLAYCFDPDGNIIEFYEKSSK